MDKHECLNVVKILILVTLILKSLVLAAEMPSSYRIMSQVTPGSLQGLEFRKIDQDSVLVTKGFPYDKEFSFANPHVIQVLEAEDLDHLLFNRTLLSMTMDSTSGKLTAIPANAAVNLTWEFSKPDIAFRIDDYVYISMRKGSRIEFTRDGVILRGFYIVPSSDYKPQSPK